MKDFCNFPIVALDGLLERGAQCASESFDFSTGDRFGNADQKHAWSIPDMPCRATKGPTILSRKQLGVYEFHGAGQLDSEFVEKRGVKGPAHAGNFLQLSQRKTGFREILMGHFAHPSLPSRQR